MQENNTFKYLSIVLAIVALILAVLYFTKPSQPVSETFSDISTQAQECTLKIEAWQKENGGKATIPVEARNSLDVILKSCQATFEDVQDKI